jgi:regulator of protease activity HflC (stomatin/prohibitin superfamily)
MKMLSFSPALPSPLQTFARLTGLQRVDDHTGVTVHRFGRYVRTLGPGWHWTMPGIDQLGRPVSLIGHHLDVSGAGGGHAELYYQILDPARAGPALDQVDQLVSDQTRDAMAAMPGPGEPGRSLSDLLKAELNRRVAGHGLRVIRCSLHAA